MLIQFTFSSASEERTWDMIAVYFGLQVKINDKTTLIQIPLECPKTHTHTHAHSTGTHAWTSHRLDPLWISITAYLLRFRYQLITSVCWDKIIELESTGCCHFQCCRCFCRSHLTKEWQNKTDTNTHAQARLKSFEKREWE